MKRIAICLICTGKYDVFLPQLLKSIDEKFLVNHSVSVEVFTDKMEELTYRMYITKLDLRRIGLTYRRIESLKFPEATLLRYHKILEAPGAWYGVDYIYYMDVDMRIENEVGEEIFGDLVAVGHPGYSVVGGGGWCNIEHSKAYIRPEKRKMYVAGGFQGGSEKAFRAAMTEMRDNIDNDSKRGVMATWHDESHWNKYCSEHPYKLLHSGYCMVENEKQQKLWQIDKLPKFIIALDKNHKEIRE